MLTDEIYIGLDSEHIKHVGADESTVVIPILRNEYISMLLVKFRQEPILRHFLPAGISEFLGETGHMCHGSGPRS